jgi:polysaccharide biosynthesis transport protein
MSEDKPVLLPKARSSEAQYPMIISAGNSDYPASTEPEDSIHLLDYWSIVTSRKWTVIAVVLTLFVAVLVITLKQIPMYRATATVEIARDTSNVLSFKDLYAADQTGADDTLQTQFKILESRSLARRVIEELHLDKLKEFQDSEPTIAAAFLDSVRALLPATPTTEQADSDPLRPVIDRYLAHVSVSPVRLARLVNVNFESSNPELAARIVNAHARHFIEQNFQFKVEATEQASEFLSTQLVTLKGNLEKSEDKLQEYSRVNQILFTDEGKNTATEKFRELEQEYTKAQADRFIKESYNGLLEKGNVEALPQFTNNSSFTALTSRLTDLRREDSDLAVTFGSEYPRRKRLRSQIDELEAAVRNETARVADTVQSEYTAALEREALLAGALDQQRDVVNRINQQIIQYNILKREVDSNKQLYDGLLNRLKEAGVSAGLKASNIRIVDPAEIPRVPVRPRKSVNLALALAAGLVFGVGLAFFQEYLDNTIKSPEEVSRFLDTPVLASIPKLSSLSRTGHGYGYGYGHREKKTTRQEELSHRLELITHESPASAMGEAYRSMRTSLLLSAPDRHPRSLVITSALPSEGKTVTAINTAISLTQTGAKVLLVDADMRKPRVHSIFGLEGALGLSSFLTGSNTLKEVIHSTVVPNLYVIPCGIIPPNPAELILSNRFQRLIPVLSEYFDFVVIDSPPLVNVSDARIVACASDCAILVLKAFATSRHQAKKALDHLAEARTRIAGIVLNDLDVRSRSGYGYYSGNYVYRRYGTDKTRSA